MGRLFTHELHEGKRPYQPLTNQNATLKKGSSSSPHDPDSSPPDHIPNSGGHSNTTTDQRQAAFSRSSSSLLSATTRLTKTWHSTNREFSLAHKKKKLSDEKGSKLHAKWRRQKQSTQNPIANPFVCRRRHHSVYDKPRVLSPL